MILRPLVQLLNRTSLVLQIAIGLVAGIALALLAPQATDEVGFLGTLFISALKAVAPAVGSGKCAWPSSASSSVGMKLSR